MQQNLSKYDKFESAERLCDQYNNLINTLRKEQSIDTGEKYLWLDDSNERKHMTDREILEKIHKFGQNMFDRERKEGSYMYLLYKYKGAFSLRDEIGTCPNIEVGIDMMDRSPLFY